MRAIYCALLLSSMCVYAAHFQVPFRDAEAAESSHTALFVIDDDHPLGFDDHPDQNTNVEQSSDLNSRSWSFTRSPAPGAVDHLLFDTVRTALEHWPHTRYRNGHTIIPGVVPPGTLLYHGTSARVVPSVPQWTATDPEHSLLFCRPMWQPRKGGGGEKEEGRNGNTTSTATSGEGGCWHLTLSTTRALNVLYFDGSSAAKMPGGPMDTQDVVAWGAIRPERVWDESGRIKDLCKWARDLELGSDGSRVDGFVRMEMDFEIMLCDFTPAGGVSVVSFLNLAPAAEEPPRPPKHPRKNALTTYGALRNPDNDTSPGSPIGVDHRVLEAGSWHNAYPGDVRVRLDFARAVSFYDAQLAPALARARARQEQEEQESGNKTQFPGVPRLRYRVGTHNGTDEVLQDEIRTVRSVLEAEVREWLSEVGRTAGVDAFRGSGVDWQTLYNTITQRYAARIEVLAYILSVPGYSGDGQDLSTANATASAGRAQRQLRSMIAPYVLYGAMPSPSTPLNDTESNAELSWALPILAQCAEAHTAGVKSLPGLTRAEQALLRGAQAVEGEVCRVLVGMWAEGVVQGLGPGTGPKPWVGARPRLGAADAELDALLVDRWRTSLQRLMGWLDWSAEWLRCRPECSFGELCVLPTWPYFTKSEGGRLSDAVDPQPHCIPVVEPLED